MKESYRQMQMNEQFIDFPPVLTPQEKTGYEELKERKGCVMRSLESALGVPATYEEWNCRLEYVNAASDLLAHAKKSQPGCNNDQTKTNLQEIDRQDILYMIQSFSLNDSPMGRVLSQMDVSMNSYPGQLIVDLLQCEDIQILLFDYSGKSPHLAHIGITADKTIISQSDNVNTLKFDTGAEYFAITLTPIRTPEWEN